MIIKHLSWDSSFWEFSVAEIEHVPERPCSASTDDLSAFRVVQALVHQNQRPSLQYMANNGFFPVDTRVEYRLELARTSETSTDRSLFAYEFVDHCKPDHDMIVFAEQLAQESRFRSFPVAPQRVTEFYLTWMKNAQTGTFDDGLFVAKTNGVSCGIVTYRIRPESVLVGLVAVHPACQKQGVGRALLSKLVEVAQESGLATIDVVTEGSNVGAQRLYQAAGFRLVQTRLWMYRING